MGVATNGLYKRTDTWIDVTYFLMISSVGMWKMMVGTHWWRNLHDVTVTSDGPVESSVSFSQYKNCGFPAYGNENQRLKRGTLQLIFFCALLHWHWITGSWKSRFPTLLLQHVYRRYNQDKLVVPWHLGISCHQAGSAWINTRVVRPSWGPTDG